MNRVTNFVDGIIRMSTKLDQLGVTLPSDAFHTDSSMLMPFRTANDTLGLQPHERLLQSKFGLAILDHLSEMNAIYLQKLIHSEANPPEWHVIEYTEYWPYEMVDDVECARSMDRCIR